MTTEQNPRPNQTFVTLYRQWALPLMKFIVKRMGGNVAAAEEVFSQTALSAWKGYSTFESKSSFFTWVCRIALNKSADYYREQIHQRSVLVAPTLEELANFKSNELSAEEKLALMELRVAVRSCLDSLPEEKRQLLYLHFWKELTVKKIADLTGASERSVEGKIYRAKMALKKVLKTQHPELVSVPAALKNQPSR